MRMQIIYQLVLIRQLQIHPIFYVQRVYFFYIYDLYLRLRQQRIDASV